MKGYFSLVKLEYRSIFSLIYIHESNVKENSYLIVSHDCSKNFTQNSRIYVFQLF